MKVCRSNSKDRELKQLVRRKMCCCKLKELFVVDELHVMRFNNEFWNALELLAHLRHFGKHNFIEQMREFLLAIDNDMAENFIDFTNLLYLCHNLQRIQKLIEQRMTPRNERELRNLAFYFIETPRVKQEEEDDAFSRLASWLYSHDLHRHFVCHSERICEKFLEVQCDADSRCSNSDIFSSAHWTENVK